MNITVIGTLNKDLILPFNNTPIESYGGIFYDIAILSYLLGEDDRVIPVSYLGTDVAPQVQAILKKMPNVQSDGLKLLDQKNHKVILEYKSPSERHEKALFNFPPLTWDEIQPFAESDFFIVNMITGWDITLEAFQRLGAKHRERLYFDVHFLVMGIDELGRRFPKRPQNIQEWLEVPRFLQLNRREFQIIDDQVRSPVEFHKKYLSPDQVLLITREAEGATVVYQSHGKITSREIPGYRVKRLVDPTGCGDAFGAGFVVHFARTGDLLAAVDFANLVGAANATIRGTTQVNMLTEKMEEIKQANRR